MTPSKPVVIRAFSPEREVSPETRHGPDHVRAILEGGSCSGQVYQHREKEIYEKLVKDIYAKFDELKDYHNKDNIYEKFANDIYNKFEGMKCDIYDMMAELQPSIKEIKEKVFQDHITTGIQLDRLRDDIQVEIKDLRESLWYQCDHMKFVNLINNKFSELNKKIDKHIYEPNTKIYTDKIHRTSLKRTKRKK